MDITRMGLRRLKFIYGESNGRNRDAEAELQRRGFNSKHLRQVIWDYGGIKWAEISSEAKLIAWRKKKHNRRVRKRIRRQEREACRRQAHKDKMLREKAGGCATEPKPRIIYFGKYKGSLMSEVPDNYLAWCYGSFSGLRKEIGRELRSRGCDREDLEYITTRYRHLGKYPKKQE